MIAKNADRVVLHTSVRSNERIRHELRLSVLHHAEHPGEIEARLRELDEEWDLERVLATHSSIVSLLGLALALRGSRRWLLLPLLAQAFSLQHALQGWCPRLPLLRAFGVRTQQEIEEERYALRLLRGDFEQASGQAARDPETRGLLALRALERRGLGRRAAESARA